MRSYDLIIIGAGPGGYEIAARQAAAGRKVALFECDKPGGTCLNRGCIPTKCLCATAQAAVDARRASTFGVATGDITIDFPTAVARMHDVVNGLRDGIETLLANSGVEVIRRCASVASGRRVIADSEEYTAATIIIATGSRPAILPVDGAANAMTSDEILALDHIPASLAIIGGGVIGLEFASIFNALGSEVTVVEYCKEVLPPFDTEIAKRLRTLLTRRGIKFRLGAAATAITARDGEGYTLHYEDKKGEASVDAEIVLMAVGRRAVVPDGCAEAGIELTSKGFIAVDDTMRTTADGFYAVGDCNGLCMLAHAATAQSQLALGGNSALAIMPSAVFTIPEAAMVGATEEQCKAQGIDYVVAKRLYGSNGKAASMGATDGIVKIIYSPATRLMLGCHVVGAHAADIIAEAAAVIYGKIPVDRLSDGLIHAHPTLSELLSASH